MVEICGMFVFVTVNDNINACPSQQGTYLLEVGQVGEWLEFFAKAGGAEMMVHYGDTQLPPMSGREEQKIGLEDSSLKLTLPNGEKVL